ncbi:hypothetical protein DSO57_1032205 [Entomophthora muscae]|nr:hypothetical protein DSO57_1032205 [Entomophthora muscae]
MNPDAKDDSKAHISKLESLLQKAKSKVTPEVKSLSAVPSHRLNFEDEDYLDHEQDQAAWDEELPQNPLLESSSGIPTHLDKLTKYQVHTGENSSEGECPSDQEASDSDLEFSDEHPKNEYLPFPTSGGGSDAGSEMTEFKNEPASGALSASLDSEMFLISDPRDRKITSASKYVQYMGAEEEYDSSVEDFTPEANDPASLSDIISFTALDPHLYELSPEIPSKMTDISLVGSMEASKVTIDSHTEPSSSIISPVEPPQLLDSFSNHRYEDFLDYDEEAALLNGVHYDTQPLAMTAMLNNNIEAPGRKIPGSNKSNSSWYVHWFCCVPSSAHVS